MANATVFKSAGTCTDATLQKLYRDPAGSASTLFCYDALDPYSWPSQAAPSGAATLVDLLDINNASIAATALGWANGFVFDGVDTDLITLPASSKLAADVSKFGIAWWINPTTIAGTGKGISGIGSGSSFANCQYALYRTNANLLFNAVGNNAVGGNIPIVAGTPIHVGITLELSGGSYSCKAWANGVQSSTTVVIAGPMPQPGIAAATIGALTNIFNTAGDDFKFYRCQADSLSSRTAAAFIAADYAAGVGRFS